MFRLFYLTANFYEISGVAVAIRRRDSNINKISLEHASMKL